MNKIVGYLRNALTRLKPAGRMLRIRYQKTFVLSLALFYITTYTDTIAFEPAGPYWINTTYYVIKAIILVMFIAASQLIPYLYYEYRKGNRAVRLYVNYFFAYMGIMTIVWLLLYPGAKHDVDEAYILFGARTLDVTLSWHHSLAVVWYAIALGVFPSLAAITFVEIVLISAIIAYVMKELHHLVGKRSQWMFYVFLLPSVIGFNFTPLRMSIYAFLEMLLIFVLVRKYMSGDKFSYGAMIGLGILTGVMASVRPESIVFIVLIPIVIAVLFVRTKQVGWRTIGAFVVAAIIGLSGVSMLQNLNTKEKTMYQVTGIMEPLSFIVKGGDYRYNDKDHAKRVIDRAIDYDRLVAGEIANDVYWSRVDRTLSDENLSSLKGLFVQLIVNNPEKFIKGCAKNFLKSNFVWPDLSKNGIPPYIDYRFTENLIAYRPISEGTRDTTLEIIRTVAFDHTHYTPMARIVYNVMIVMAMLGILVVYMIRRKDILLIILLPLVAKNVVVMVTAPFPSFYYYYPLQLTGLVLLVMYVLFMRSNESKKYRKRLENRKHEPWYRFGS